MERATEGDDVIRAGAAALSGLALWGQGDLEAALRGYSICLDGLRRSGHISDALGASIAVADITITQGRLHDAARTFEQGLQLAAAEVGPTLRGTADMHVGLSRIAYERDDLGAAAQHLERARELGEHTWMPQNPYRWRVAMAAVREADGDLDGALGVARRGATRLPGRLLAERQAGACDARSSARGAGSAHRRSCLGAGAELSADDELSYLREFEHITLARVLLAQSQPGSSARRLADGRNSSTGCCKRPKTASAPAASSRSWCCKPSTDRRTATLLARSSRWNVR